MNLEDSKTTHSVGVQRSDLESNWISSDSPVDRWVYRSYGLAECEEEEMGITSSIEEANGNQFRLFFTQAFHPLKDSGSLVKKIYSQNYIIIEKEVSVTSSGQDWFKDNSMKLVSNYMNLFLEKSFISNSLESIKDRFSARNNNSIQAIISEAEDFLISFLEGISDKIDTWKRPNFSLSDDGQLDVSWWIGVNELHFHFSEEDRYYTQVWGENIYNSMRCSDLEIEEAKDLWLFLLQGRKLKVSK